ncbi:MAG: STAS domain-containing protein [Vitreoscilla sp.]|jgi:phospholipid transport system transporter-binding protein|nr:STAS domain-containing protein [Vitreoscilla sp.]
MGSTDTLALPAQLTLPEARAALETLEAAIAEASGAVAVDASALTHIDSATLAVLLQCRRSAQARKLGFSVQNAPQRLVDLAKLYGVEELLSLA